MKLDQIGPPEFRKESEHCWRWWQLHPKIGRLRTWSTREYGVTVSYANAIMLLWAQVRFLE